MVSLIEATKDKNRRILVYGDSGMGKTFSLTTLPVSEKHRVLIIDSENGLGGIVDPLQDAGLVEHFDVETVVGERLPLTKAIEILSRTDLSAYKFIILDSLSDAIEKEKTSLLERGGDQRQEYGKVATAAIKLMNILQNAPCISIAMAWASKAPKANQPSTASSLEVLSPNLSFNACNSKLPYLFTDVFCVTTETNIETGLVERKWVTQNNGLVQAKNRQGLPSVVPADFRRVLTYKAKRQTSKKELKDG